MKKKHRNIRGQHLFHFSILLSASMLLISNSLFSQDRTEYLIENLLKLYQAPSVWDDSTNNQNDTLKNYALNRFFHNSVEDYVGRPGWTTKLTLDSFITFYSSSFHLLDLNADNNIELVFSGKRFQRMGSVTIIYTFDGKSFIEQNRFDGEVVQLIKGNRNFIDMVICRYPCCGEYDNDFSYLEMKNSNYVVTGSLTFSKGAQFYFCNTSLPKTINSPKDIILNKGIELNYWYLSDTIPTCYPFNDKSVTTFGVTKKKIKTVYYGTYENGKKNKWYFVKITSKMRREIQNAPWSRKQNNLVWVTQ